jgi:hypothetical protein
MASSWPNTGLAENATIATKERRRDFMRMDVALG